MWTRWASCASLSTLDMQVALFRPIVLVCSAQELHYKFRTSWKLLQQNSRIQSGLFSLFLEVQEILFTNAVLSVVLLSVELPCKGTQTVRWQCYTTNCLIISTSIGSVLIIKYLIWSKCFFFSLVLCGKHCSLKIKLTQIVRMVSKWSAWVTWRERFSHCSDCAVLWCVHLWP